MGSVAKRLGQLTALSLESESAKIIRTIEPNKIPNSLSQRLDTTLKDSHDMKVFGMGTLASMASRDRYLRFTHAMYGVYSTMEEELDRCSVALPPSPNINNEIGSTSNAIAHFWNRHSEILRRADKLESDILDLSPHDAVSSEYSTATEEYRTALRDAGTKDRQDNGGRLLGHAYTRYLADLMGGQVLGRPTRLALGLEADGSPQQYSFMFPVDRKTYVADFYCDLNEAGRLMDDDDARLEDAVAEARAAFGYNVKVYSEEPFVVDSVIGLLNIGSGWLLRR